jgi:hypothetical protein
MSYSEEKDKESTSIVKYGNRFVKQYSEARQRAKEHLKRYARVTKVLKEFDDPFSEEAQTAIVEKLKDLLHLPEDECFDLYEQCLGYAIVKGKLPALQAFGMELLENLREGLAETNNNKNRQYHLGYIQKGLDMMKIVDEKTNGSIGIFEQGNARGIIASGKPAALIATIREAMTLNKQDLKEIG